MKKLTFSILLISCLFFISHQSVVQASNQLQNCETIVFGFCTRCKEEFEFNTQTICVPKKKVVEKTVNTAINPCGTSEYCGDANRFKN